MCECVCGQTGFAVIASGATSARFRRFRPSHTHTGTHAHANPSQHQYHTRTHYKRGRASERIFADEDEDDDFAGAIRAKCYRPSAQRAVYMPLASFNDSSWPWRGEGGPTRPPPPTRGAGAGPPRTPLTNDLTCSCTPAGQFRAPVPPLPLTASRPLARISSAPRSSDFQRRGGVPVLPDSEGARRRASEQSFPTCLPRRGSLGRGVAPQLPRTQFGEINDPRRHYPTHACGSS